MVIPLLSGFHMKNKYQAREEEGAEEIGCGFSSPQSQAVQVDQHRVVQMLED